MITCRELDRRLKELYPNFQEMAYGTARLDFMEFMGSYRNHELEQYTHDLQDLLSLEGFSCRYEPNGVSTAQDIWLQMLPGPSGIMRVTVRYDGILYTDCGSSIPRIAHGVLSGPATIEKLVAALHSIRYVLQEMPPCNGCHYYSHQHYYEGGFCGKGLAMVKGCTGYRRRKG